MTKTIEFFYDVASPWSYLASTQIASVAERCSIELQYRPFLLGGVFKATHNQSPVSIPAKGTYMMKDIKRWCDRYKVDFNMPTNFPINSLLAMRCLTAEETNKLPELTKQLFTAYWIDGTDISDRYTLIDLLGEDIIDKANQEITKEKLKMTTHEAVKRGAFGAPTFFVEDEMFFGADRLDMLEYFLTKR